MSVTRRRFIKTGTMVAAAAGFTNVNPLRASTDDMAPQALPQGVPVDVLADPLWGIPRAAWIPHEGTTFAVYSGRKSAGTIRLERVTDLRSRQQPRPPVGQECFSLLFKNTRKRVLPQGVYTLEHGVLGRVDLLLVPVVSRKNPLTTIEAIINRVEPPR